MLRKRPVVLSIAGFDPCGGAGVLADIKTIEQHSVLGMAVITANTIQTENDVAGLEWQSLDYVLNGITTIVKKYPVSVFKIGVLPGFCFLKGIVYTIKAINPDAFIIWDPVLKSSSGVQFFRPDDLRYLGGLLGWISLVTPNYIEYGFLKKYCYLEAAHAVLIKGGHRQQLKGTDLLIQGQKEIPIPPVFGDAFAKHGSGCVLSAAIASNIALGSTLLDACRSGKIYVEQFLNSTPSLLGHHSYVS